MDSHRRGRAVQRDKKRPRVSSLYRPILPVIWAVGGVLWFLAVGFSTQAGVTVIIVLHVFFAGLIRADIKSLRKQGLKWGHSRHLWFGAALTLPFVVPAYYLYAGRQVRAENESRGYTPEGDWAGVGEDDDATSDGGATTGTAATPASDDESNFGTADDESDPEAAATPTSDDGTSDEGTV